MTNIDKFITAKASLEVAAMSVVQILMTSTYPLLSDEERIGLYELRIKESILLLRSALRDADSPLLAATYIQQGDTNEQNSNEDHDSR